MNNMPSEHVGKVFVVVRGMQRCLICDRMFAPSEAAEHATEPCRPAPDHRNTNAAEQTSYISPTMNRC